MFLWSSLVILGSCLVEARSRQHVGKSDIAPQVRASSLPVAAAEASTAKPASAFLNKQSQAFVVNGTGLPNVDFDVGESYAGLLPISSDPNESRKLFFWFFPSTDPAASDEITIWLNGGPGCSSLEGLLQENGPFLWQFGTFKPVANPWSWNKLTNMLWVEQPVGTGFSEGVPSVGSEEDVASQFLGFFHTFVDTFAAQGKKVFIAGESYAGMYVPAIANAMLDKQDTKYFNLDSIMIYDPVIGESGIQDQVVANSYINHWQDLFSLNATTRATLSSMSDKCGYTSFLDTHLTFPPTAPFPPLNASPGQDCDVWGMGFNAALQINPCFDEYQITSTCPVLWDVLGFPGSFGYQAPGTQTYFNRPDVQKAINAPIKPWTECANANVFVNGVDNSLPSSQDTLPRVIERAKRTIIGSGALDYIIIGNGTLLAIQNMTWGGAQGFQSKPSDMFYVPYHDNSFTNEGASALAGAGVFGTTHTERGLTYVEVSLSGHQIPQYAPSAAYRQLQFLLGRISSLTS